MVMDYWRLKIPCLKTTWNINCGEFKNQISISKHENVSGDETGFTVTNRSRAKDIPSMLLCLVFNRNKHGQPLGHVHETWLICIKYIIYLIYTLCIMAVILQTRCFQMDNCEPDLSFSKYVERDCFCWLYIYGHICDFLSRYAQLKEYILLQSEQPGDWHQMRDNMTPGTGLKPRWSF